MYELISVYLCIIEWPRRTKWVFTEAVDTLGPKKGWSLQPRRLVERIGLFRLHRAMLWEQSACHPFSNSKWAKGEQKVVRFLGKLFSTKQALRARFLPYGNGLPRFRVPAAERYWIRNQSIEAAGRQGQRQYNISLSVNMAWQIRKLMSQYKWIYAFWKYETEQPGRRLLFPLPLPPFFGGVEDSRTHFAHLHW